MPDDRPPFFLADFDAAAAYRRAANHLAAAVTDAAHPFHWPALGTVTPGGPPVVRTVVLRAFDGVERVAIFHTDARADKVPALRALPVLMLHFYDHPSRFQVQMPATATLHHGDAVARAEWGRLSDHGRGTYAPPDEPGTVLAADAPATPAPAVPASDEGAFANFVAVRCHFDELELLELHRDGNRRAVLLWEAGGPRLVRVAP